jgi:iron complex outermembrane receptor protein
MRTQLSAIGFWLAGASGISLAFACAPATAAQTTPIAKSYNIPSQSLSGALNAYAEQSGVEILFAPGMVRGKRSRELRGSYAADEALAMLLTGTGLVVRQGSGPTVLIERAPQGAYLIRQAPSSGEETAGSAATTSESADIIVTARRVDERLQDVPISISVFTQDALAKRNIEQMSDLASYAPGLMVNQRYGAERASFSIRGFNQDAGTSPSVGLYFAEVPGIRVQGGTIAGNSMGPGVFMDLQNVQVLKGPQGTLFGRNTTGGAVLLVPNKPTDRFEGWVEGQIGNYDSRRVQAMINIPLADTFKVRFAVDRNKRDGYLRNMSADGPKDFMDTDYIALRGTVLAELTPTLQNTLIFHYNKSTNNGNAGRLVACGRSSITNPAVGTTAISAAAACDQLDRQTARGDSLLDVEVYNPGGFFRAKQWQVINTTAWEASDAITVKNIASYGEYAETSQISTFSENFVISTRTPSFRTSATAPIIQLTPGTRFQPTVTGYIPGSVSMPRYAFTEELQIQGRTDRFTWVAGGYLEANRQAGFGTRRNIVSLSCAPGGNPSQCLDIFGTGNISEPRYKYDFLTYAVFGEGTFDITDQLALTAGARYTVDKAHGEAENSRIVRVGTPAEVRQCTDSLRFRSGLDAAGRPIPLNVTNASQCHSEIDNNSKEPTWNLNLTYKPTADIMLYGRYARGYREGAINLTAIGLETWKPETVDSFEIGAKASFHGAVSGYFNIAGFYNKLRDQQINARAIPRPETGLPQTSTVINVGHAITKGVEVDASALLFESLRFDIGYIYLKTNVKGIPTSLLVADSPFSAIQPTVADNSPLTFSPRNRITATATYTLPLPEAAGEFSVGATFTHTASQIADRSATFGVLPVTDLLNLNATWKSVLGSSFDASAFVTNVTNKIYAVTGQAGAGLDTITPGQPRIWGFRLRYNFGD